MKRLFFVLLVSLNVLLGCQPAGTQYHVSWPADVAFAVEKEIWVDQDFSAEDKAGILKGVEAWNKALNGYVKLTVVDWNFDMSDSKIKEGLGRAGWFILKIDSTHPSLVGKNWLAYCNKVGGNFMYLVRDRFENEDVPELIMHELGHLLGSDHVGGKLMYQYYRKDRYRCIDKETITSVAKAYGLEVDRLNYCY